MGISPKNLSLDGPAEKPLFATRKCLSLCNKRGAITVEYALCMIFAALIMFGVFFSFKVMSVQIINEFKQYVIFFPNN